MSTEKSALTVNCPHCQRPVAWTADNPFKPFCNQRCKLIDLGEWVAETRKIPGDPLFDENFPDDMSPH